MHTNIWRSGFQTSFTNKKKKMEKKWRKYQVNEKYD